jgi:hypothetical protein
MLPAPVKRCVVREKISSNRAAVCACIRRFKGVAPCGRTHSSRFPRGHFWRSALSRLLFSSISSVCGPARGGASCARPVVLVSPSLEVGPRVVGLCSLFSLLAAGARRPVSLWRLLCRPSPRAASFCGALLSYRFKQSPPADPLHYHRSSISRPRTNSMIRLCQGGPSATRPAGRAARTAGTAAINRAARSKLTHLALGK